MQTTLKVTQLTNTEWLVWKGDQQVASFNESKNWGPEGIWSENSYFGPNAKAKADDYVKRHLPVK
jgi:hypothetical protein